MSLYGPDQRRQTRIHTRQAQPDERPEYLACSVCGFPVPFDTVPGEGFPTTMVTTGTQYVWESADDALSTLDLQVFPQTQQGIACGFCGATNYFTGSRGSQ